MALASTLTLLPLDRYAAVMGIDPFTFNGATVSCLGKLDNCAEVWLQNNGRYAGIEYLAEQIAHVETMLADHLCTPMAPTWIEDETNSGFGRFPTFRRNQTRTAINFTTRYNHIYEFAKRQAEKLGDGMVAYSDTDGDGYKETATVTLALVEAPDLTAVSLYTPNTIDANPTDEIRPFSRVEYSGGNLTFKLPTYLLIDPTARQLATEAIDVCEAANLLSSVEVWQETAVSADVMLTYDKACASCDYETAEACVQVKDGRRGRARAELTDCRDGLPITATYSYRAGLPLTRDGRLAFERAICLLVTARMDYEICNCGVNIRTLDYYKRDMSVRDDGFFKLDENAPVFFGTRVGEVMAAREITNRKKVWV